MKNREAIQNIIQRNKQAHQANEQQLQTESDSRLENDYKLALQDIQNATNINALNRPADYFRGTKFEQNILNACQAKSDMEGWSA
jgi:tRNA G18 (ribose-2'-O)-methylase SpoU